MSRLSDIQLALKKSSQALRNTNKLPEQVKQDVIESMTKFDVEGDFVQFTPKEGSEIKVVTTFTGHNPYWKHHELHQVTSKNLHDFVNRLGGVGTVIEKDGLKAVINDDYTVTITGTNTSSGWVNIVECINNPGYNDYVYPPGTYTTPDKLIVQLISTDGLTNFGNKQKTFTVDAPFRIRGAYIAYNAGNSANETIPLCVVRGTVIPQTDYKYSGKVYKAYFTKEYAEGTYDWSTGNLYDTDGNLLETTAVVGISALSGENSMWVGNGTVKAIGNTAGMSIGSVEAFDPELWGLPILRLTGETQAMNKDNAVELSYAFGARKGTCTVKWQGSSSIAYPKKNYTIKFDNAFEAVEGWGEQKKYCAKANWIDHSHARNVVNAKLWGQIVKSRKTIPAELANLVNGGAVDGFPILIMINDEFKGLYTFNIPKDGWMFGMGSATNEAIICADKWVPATYYKAEAKIDGTDFKLEYATDEDNAEWVVTSINRLINACMVSDGSDLDTTIAQYLDWDSAIDYLIFTVMIVGSDMTGKNYLNATFDGVKWFFSAYDMDCTYCLNADGSKFLPANYQPSFAQFAANHKVMELIVNYKKDALKARYAELRETVLSESNIATEFANFAGLIPSPVLMQDVKLWPGIPNTSVNNIGQIRDAYRLRCALADKWIEQL